MAKKIVTMLERYQENVSPAMLQDLSRQLGVSYESLARLEIGWAPIVHFKKGANHQGWWAIPERNEKGDLAGVGLRSQDNFKCMHPSGGGRGLIYAINQDHMKGDRTYGYKPGPANWTRTMDAGVSCPICGKPDGCLVSSEDSYDPQAVICIRESEGSKKPVRGGGSWLHIRKAAGDVNKNSPLIEESDYPVIIVEGMTDVAAAMDLGFVSVGRPSSNSGFLELAELVRGRSVVVVGENDLKPDGSVPGHKGMLATAQVLRRTCPDVLKLMPPSDCKDLRVWLSLRQLTRDEFLAYAEERGDRSVDTVVLSDDHPLTAGLAYLDDMYKVGTRYTLRKWKGNTYYRYASSRYIESEEVDVSGPMYGWAKGKSNIILDKNGEEQIKGIKADRRWVGNVMASIHQNIMLDPDKVSPPCWINGIVGPGPHELIPFINGIVDVNRYLAGEPCLHDLTPDYFNLISIPYEFDEVARCGRWVKFIDEALGDDPDKIKLLQQWFGYCMTFDNQFQKFMILRGVKQSGKSTILNVLRALVGNENYFASKFDKLQSQFGLEAAIGKLVCGIDDAQITRKTDVNAVIEVMKAVSGDAPSPIDQKFKKSLTVPLRARFTLTCNETPYLPDNADAMARRMLLLEFENEKKRPDRQLLQKLERELPGIAVWAFEGLKSLHRELSDGSKPGFIEPKSMKLGMETWKEFTNPVGTFYSECLTHTPGKYVSSAELMQALGEWCIERGIKSPSMARFHERIKFTAPTDVQREKISHPETGRPLNILTNVSLQQWAIAAYLTGERR